MAAKNHSLPQESFHPGISNPMEMTCFWTDSPNAFTTNLIHILIFLSGLKSEEVGEMSINEQCLKNGHHETELVTVR